MYLPFQAVHSGNPPSTGANPLEAPKKYTDRFPNIADPNRKLFAGLCFLSCIPPLSYMYANVFFLVGVYAISPVHPVIPVI